MRITIKQLEQQIDYLNELTNNPLKPYGNKGANIGCYYLAGAYGGYQLQQIVNEGGGCRTLLNTGYTTKKNLYNNINSLLLGLELKNKQKGDKMKYEQALNYKLTRKETKNYIQRHGLRFTDFENEVGSKQIYKGLEVLNWLGYQ